MIDRLAAARHYLCLPCPAIHACSLRECAFSIEVLVWRLLAGGQLRALSRIPLVAAIRAYVPLRRGRSRRSASARIGGDAIIGAMDHRRDRTHERVHIVLESDKVGCMDHRHIATEEEDRLRTAPSCISSSHGWTVSRCDIKRLSFSGSSPTS